LRGANRRRHGRFFGCQISQNVNLLSSLISSRFQSSSVVLCSLLVRSLIERLRVSLVGEREIEIAVILPFCHNITTNDSTMALAEQGEGSTQEHLVPEAMIQDHATVAPMETESSTQELLAPEHMVQEDITMALVVEHGSSMLEQLAPELVVRVLGFMDIRDRVQLAGCNTRLQKRVHQDCPQAWSVITFCNVKGCQRLTDGHLSKLLTRVNAKEVTTKLNLIGCKEIRGHGLAPLRFSTVLGTIGLQGTGAKDNLTPFLWILYTMIPFKLYALTVDYKLFEEPSEELTDFLWKLREAKLQQAQETTCITCEQPVVDTSRQVVPNVFGIPETFCSGCRKPYCKRGSCPMCIRECGYCGESYCENCKIIGQCGFCGRSHCNVPACGGKFESCVSCGKLCCKDCEGSLVNCDYCKKRKTCLDCANYDVCQEDCTLCVICQAKGNCSVCNGQFCIKCIERNVRQCEQCREIFCDKSVCQSLVEHCGASACNLVHCKNCREFEYCITCERSFCLMHDRLEDCFKCGMRHCRACGYQRQCAWCQRACFDDCTCDEHHPKKAKTSSAMVTQK